MNYEIKTLTVNIFLLLVRYVNGNREEKKKLSNKIVAVKSSVTSS